MNTRLNIRSSSRAQVQQSPRTSSSKLDGPQSSRSSSTYLGSRTRSHEPKPRPSTYMEPPTPTPTPRRPRRHNKGSQRPEQREPVPALEPDNECDSDACSLDELLSLLGTVKSDSVSIGATLRDLPDPPKKGGILAISKADIVESKKGGRRGKKTMVDGEVEGKASLGERKTPRKREAKKSHTVDKGFDVTENESLAESATGSAGTLTRNNKGLKAKQSKPSGIASTLAEHKSSRLSAKSHDNDLARYDISSKPFDMSTLSRSLPDQHDNVFGGMERQDIGSKAEEKSDVWDMPPKSASETLNQTLQPSPEARKTSRGSERKVRKAPSAFQPSALNPSRPAHSRRASTDGLPVPSHPHPPRSAPPLDPSAFDQDGSYHIGYNVNRPPQTPSKSNLRGPMSTAPLPLITGGLARPNNKVFDKVFHSGIHPHPLVHSQSAPNSNTKVDGVVYAGPISHNSPHARALAKPDLDEF